MTVRSVRLLHLSDIHCGHPFVREHVEAAYDVIKSAHFDAIVISGDLTQRAREREFREARAIIDRFRAVAPLLVVPGNHDSEWWHAPFGFGEHSRVHERWRKYIQEEVEPTLRLPGVSIIGMNSAAGLMPWTLTWNPRDLRVKGGLTAPQLADARSRLQASARGDLRVLVTHHNVVRGFLSRRWGLARPQQVLDAISSMEVHVVCTGHDHEERVELLERNGARWIVSAANTLSTRARGKRAASINVIESDGSTVQVTPWVYEQRSTSFVASTGVSMHTELARI